MYHVFSNRFPHRLPIPTGCHKCGARVMKECGLTGRNKIIKHYRMENKAHAYDPNNAAYVSSQDLPDKDGNGAVIKKRRSFSFLSSKVREGREREARDEETCVLCTVYCVLCAVYCVLCTDTHATFSLSFSFSSLSAKAPRKPCADGCTSYFKAAGGCPMLQLMQTQLPILDGCHHCGYVYFIILFLMIYYNGYHHLWVRRRVRKMFSAAKHVHTNT
jgi:hypothetical protein